LLQVAQRLQDLLSLSISRGEKKSLKESGIPTNDTLELRRMLRLYGVVLDSSSERSLGGILTIHSDIDLIVSRKEVGRVINLVGSVSIGASLDLGDLQLGSEVGFDIIVAAGAKVALVILYGNLGTAATSKTRLGDLDLSLAGIKTTGGNDDLERSIDDRMAINGGGQSVVTSLVHRGVLARVGAIAVVLNSNWNSLASGIIDEFALNISSTLSEVVVEVIASLN